MRTTAKITVSKKRIILLVIFRSNYKSAGPDNMLNGILKTGSTLTAVWIAYFNKYNN